MCELDYKAASDTDNNTEKHKSNNLIKTSISQSAGLNAAKDEKSIRSAGRVFRAFITRLVK